MENLVGKTFAGCQIVELIDDIARTAVYKGYQAGEDRYVAVKVLKESAAADPAVVQSFTQYAQLAARMQHPNILPVLTSGQENNANYLLAPFMEHRSVAEQWSVYHDLYQAQALIAAIVQGLEYIYSQGYFHGNLRPTNILLGDQWQPLLADFSMAMRQGETPTRYNSPEQVQGGVVDQRTDVYALGVILYELLTGQAPAPGTVFNLSAKRPDLSQSVEQSILKATAQNPGQRFQTAREFLNALQAASSQPAAAPAPAPTPPTVSQNVQVQQPRGTSNCFSVVLGGIGVLLAILCLVVAIPRVMNIINPQGTVMPPVAGQPIQPPEIQPTQPPEGIPTQAPQEPEQPVAPADTPAAGDGGVTLPSVCSSLGIGTGIVLMGGVLTLKRRKRNGDIKKEVYK